MPVKEKGTSVKIPVKLVNGQWEFLYGGIVPAEEGAVAHIHIESIFIQDKEFLAEITKTSQVQVWEESIELRVAVTMKNNLPSGSPEPFQPGSSMLFGSPYKEMPIGDYQFIKSNTYFFPIWIDKPSPTQFANGMKKGGLWLSFRGFDATGIISSTIKTDEFISKQPLTSLNHALTKLSEKYESWRISHTGNVYENVYYLEGDGHWYPMLYLRERELAQAELSVVGVLWERIAKQLNLPKRSKLKEIK